MKGQDGHLTPDVLAIRAVSSGWGVRSIIHCGPYLSSGPHDRQTKHVYLMDCCENPSESAQIHTTKPGLSE